MSKRFFTSDLHLNSEMLIQRKLRPFRTVDRMNLNLIKNINHLCTKDDILIHVGDFIQYGNDRDSKGRCVHPREFIRMLNPTLINIQGNHDLNNRMKSVCTSMRTTLGKFRSVSIGHFPSTDQRAEGSYLPGDVHIHGHIHNGQIFTIDKEHAVLNVNVCCDLWNYHPIPEDELILKIDQFMRAKVIETEEQ